MAIVANPKRHLHPAKEAQAESFISSAGQTAPAAQEDSSRKPVVLRIPGDLLKRIDQAAKRKSISRSAFIVSSMADLVNGDR